MRERIVFKVAAYTGRCMLMLLSNRLLLPPASLSTVGSRVFTVVDAVCGTPCRCTGRDDLSTITDDFLSSAKNL